MICCFLSLVRTRLLSPTSIYELMCLLTSLINKKDCKLTGNFWDHQKFPHPQKMGKVTRITSSQQFSHRKKMVGEQIFQRNSQWKPMTSCLLCWGFKPGRPWTKPLSLVIQCCKAWRKSCGEAPRRSWSRRIFQSPWGVWSLEEITTHRTHPKVSFGTLKLIEWTKKDSKLKKLRRLLLDDLRGIWADNDQTRPPKRWLWWFRFAVSIGD